MAEAMINVNGEGGEYGVRNFDVSNANGNNSFWRKTGGTGNIEIA